MELRRRYLIQQLDMAGAEKDESMRDRLLKQLELPELEALAEKYEIAYARV